MVHLLHPCCVFVCVSCNFQSKSHALSLAVSEFKSHLSISVRFHKGWDLGIIDINNSKNRYFSCPWSIKLLQRWVILPFPYISLCNVFFSLYVTTNIMTNFNWKSKSKGIYLSVFEFKLIFAYYCLIPRQKTRWTKFSNSHLKFFEA